VLISRRGQAAEEPRAAPPVDQPSRAATRLFAPQAVRLCRTTVPGRLRARSRAEIPEPAASARLGSAQPGGHHPGAAVADLIKLARAWVRAGAEENRDVPPPQCLRALASFASELREKPASPGVGVAVGFAAPCVAEPRQPVPCAAPGGAWVHVMARKDVLLRAALRQQAKPSAGVGPPGFRLRPRVAKPVPRRGRQKYAAVSQRHRRRLNSSGSSSP
jgi:hypothetical protein